MPPYHLRGPSLSRSASKLCQRPSAARMPQPFTSHRQPQDHSCAFMAVGRSPFSTQEVVEFGRDSIRLQAARADAAHQSTASASDDAYDYDIIGIGQAMCDYACYVNEAVLGEVGVAPGGRR